MRSRCTKIRVCPCCAGMSRSERAATTFPALAGYLNGWLDEVGSLTLSIGAALLVAKGLPRTRGDEPGYTLTRTDYGTSAPHSRG